MELQFAPDSIALRMGVAIGIGMLVGLEREWSNKDVGIRTFAVIALLGMVCALIGQSFIFAGVAVVLVLLLVANTRSIMVDRSLEITTSAALAVTYTLGALVGMGHTFTPVAGAIVMTMLLAWKMELQRFAGGIGPHEIRSAILLCLIGFVIYPVLPNHYIDRWSLVNPREAWVTVIIIAGLGFFNYVLLRLYNTKGLFWSALLGGLVNSTAAMTELTRTLRKGSTPLAATTLLLVTVFAMFVRNVALVAIIARQALMYALLPIVAMSVPVLIAFWLSWRAQPEMAGNVQLSSPLSVRRVLKFGALFLFIEVVAEIAHRLYGAGGFIAASTFGGFISSASAAAAAANQCAQGRVAPLDAGIAVVATSMTSAIINVPIVLREFEEKTVGYRLAAITAVQVALGVATIFAQRAWLR